MSFFSLIIILVAIYILQKCSSKLFLKSFLMFREIIVHSMLYILYICLVNTQIICQEFIFNFIFSLISLLVGCILDKMNYNLFFIVGKVLYDLLLNIIFYFSLTAPLTFTKMYVHTHIYCFLTAQLTFTKSSNLEACSFYHIRISEVPGLQNYILSWAY